jgi:hypothetical protein
MMVSAAVSDLYTGGENRFRNDLMFSSPDGNDDLALSLPQVRCCKGSYRTCATGPALGEPT